MDPMLRIREFDGVIGRVGWSDRAPPPPPSLGNGSHVGSGIALPAKPLTTEEASIHAAQACTQACTHTCTRTHASTLSGTHAHTRYSRIGVERCAWCPDISLVLPPPARPLLLAIRRLRLLMFLFYDECSFGLLCLPLPF
jgi:hypothetical protein